jgi:hypothetical protein
MKIKHILFAVITSLLLTAGLARAAESFDLVATNSKVTVIYDGLPGGPSCVILQ